MGNNEKESSGAEKAVRFLLFSPKLGRTFILGMVGFVLFAASLGFASNATNSGVVGLVVAIVILILYVDTVTKRQVYNAICAKYPRLNVLTHWNNIRQRIRQQARDRDEEY